MINSFSSYIKEIAFFLIFMIFIEIILPQSKYRNYINLVLGLLLIFIMIKPVNVLLAKFNTSIDSEIINKTIEIDKNAIEKEKQYYTEKQKELIFNNFNENLKKQLTSILNNYAYVNDVNFEIDYENLKINDIYVDISYEQKAEKEKFIRIKPIIINDDTLKDEKNEEDEKIKNIKNIISDFYNLSVDNIHITVQKKN